MEAGIKVQDIRDRSKVGTIVSGPVVMGGRKLWQVRWNDRSLSRVPESLIEPFQDRMDLWGLLQSHAFGGMEDFIRNYTHRKLLNPVDDTLYMLNASRTRLLPHQFKPLLKFLDSIHRRYLIADEVGLGKTIEAGIILSELRARERLGGVLIFCPNHLRDKWKAEMLNRFDERFDIIVSRKEWQDRVIRAAEDVGTQGFRFIVGHKTLASKHVWEALADHAPAFDLLIVDEAHHFKNSETYLRRILGELADAATQLLLLTATPLQTASDNLLSLLRLLDHTAFKSRNLFFQRLETNSRIVRAERHLRSASPDRGSIHESVTNARHELTEISPHAIRQFGIDEGNQHQRILDKLNRLLIAPDCTLAEVAEIASELRQINLLSPYVTRTRKSEVQSTSKRVVESIRPEMTPEEREFYEAVVEWCRREIRDRHGDQSVLFLSRNIERRLASSLPAFAAYLRRHRNGDEGKILSNPPAEVIRAARALDQDTKSDRLLELLERLRREKPEAKIIIFASFHGTLRYLSHRLQEGGWRHEVIHGGVSLVPNDPDRNERGRRVERFLHDPDCRVLLSSNVGGEGLDLQRASIVINYDLPWNPAVIEQRIGRIDRFGQEEQIIQVLNFILPDTVEDVIFSRLFDRLQLFELTIGEFAEVLGPIVTELSSDFLRSELTDEDREEEIRKAEWRVQNERHNLQLLLEREHELVAYDDDFADQLRQLDQQGQTIRPEDLFSVIDGILKRYFPKCWIHPAQGEWSVATPDENMGVYELFVDPQLRALLQQHLQTRESATFWRLIRRINSGSTLLVTFDGETAERNPELELITSRHPLLRLLVQQFYSADDFHRLAAIRVTGGNGDARTPGLLVLFNALFRIGVQERRYLKPVWVSADEIIADDRARRVLREALDRGISFRPTEIPSGEELCQMLDSAQSAVVEEIDRIVDRLLSKERQRVQPRVAEATERYARRRERAIERLIELTLSPHEDPESQKKIRRQQQYIRRIERERDARVQELSELPNPEIHVSAEAAAWVEFER